MTFAPYDVEVDAIVIAVDVSEPGRVIYELSGRGNKPLKTRTTGKSIVESELYRQADKADWLK